MSRSLIDVIKEFGTEQQCVAFLEQVRFPNGVTCLKCGHSKVSTFSTNETKRKRFSKKLNAEVEVRVPGRHLYTCLNSACRYQFSITTGTIFQDTHLPLSKWFLAIVLLSNAKKSISALEMKRDLKISYKTAWFLCHRVREAMENGLGEMFSGTVELDETYVGGRYDKRRARGKYDKAPVFGMLQRGTEDKPSQVSVHHLKNANHFFMAPKIKGQISLEAKVMTDESRLYEAMDRNWNREIVNHTAKEWVRGEVHTNGVEGFWSLFKRSVIGSFHKVSVKHLHRYLDECQFKFNNRLEKDIFLMVVTNLVIKDALTYSKLIGKTTSLPSEVPF